MDDHLLENCIIGGEKLLERCHHCQYFASKDINSLDHVEIEHTERKTKYNMLPVLSLTEACRTALQPWIWKNWTSMPSAWMDFALF